MKSSIHARVSNINKVLHGTVTSPGNWDVLNEWRDGHRQISVTVTRLSSTVNNGRKHLECDIVSAR